ncbi:hypothetical protein J3456_01860 [Sulfitobacter sp. NFXS29]
MEHHYFSEEVGRAVGNYVYRLIDPRNGETFYIGKGTGNRVFHHVSGEYPVQKDEEEDTASLKISRIREILGAGLQVVHVIHRHEIPDAAIFEVEAALIDAFPGLSNIQGGHGSGSKGPMNTKEVIDKYDLPTISAGPDERLVLLNINRLENKSNPDAILRQTRLAWRISRRKAQAANYVLAVVRGVVVGAFIADKWLDATHANFPEAISLDSEMPQRKGFVGRVAPDAIWEKFVGERGRRIEVEAMKHIQNPVRYWNIS